MASFDVNSLFTNIPLEETIDIIMSDIETSPDGAVCGIERTEFKKLLSLATTESMFLFNDKYYKQIDGVAMGSPLGLTLANAFMCHYEKKWLEECPSQFKPTYYRRYVDDIFVTFSSPAHVALFFNYLNSRHSNISFTHENEINNTLAYLDLSIYRKNNRFVTSIYRKPTFSGVFINFSSFIPLHYKHSLILSLLHRCFRLCSDLEKFHHEVDQLKVIFRRNGYPNKVVDFCIRNFINKIFQVKEAVATVPKKPYLVLLPFLGTLSLQIRTKIEKSLTEILPHCDPKVIFRSTRRLSNCFSFKDRLPKSLLSGLVYKFKCSDCNVTYYGKTKRHFKVRISEHLGVSPLTEKRVKPGYQSTVIFDHIFNSSTCSPAEYNDFSILARESNDFKLTLMESLLIERDRPDLNRSIKSMPLELF